MTLCLLHHAFYRKEQVPGVVVASIVFLTLLIFSQFVCTMRCRLFTKHTHTHTIFRDNGVTKMLNFCNVQTGCNICCIF